MNICKHETKQINQSDMKTNMGNNQQAKISDENSDQLGIVNYNSCSKKERVALKAIYSHAGKKLVYETYSIHQPEMAEKYLNFLSRRPWATYIKWDNDKKQFVS